MKLRMVSNLKSIQHLEIFSLTSKNKFKLNLKFLQTEMKIRYNLSKIFDLLFPFFPTLVAGIFRKNCLKS